MKGRLKFRISIAVAVLFGMLVAACAALFWAGNFLFNFALNPRADVTMKALLEAGEVDDPELEEEELLQEGMEETAREAAAWQEYCAAAKAWYEDARQSVSIVSEDGLTLYGWQLPKEGHCYAVLCHGYAGGPEQMAPYAAKFYEMGYSVLTPAAQAHERSGGKYYGMGWPERRHLIDWVLSVVMADEDAKIVLFGLSMGGATVMMAAGEELPGNVKCIIEDCGYSSVWDEFGHQLSYAFHLPVFPLLSVADLVCRMRAGYGFKEASAAEQLKAAVLPMLFIHGEEDTFVPYSMLDVVYGACASKEKERLSVPKAAHGAAAYAAPRLYWDTVEEFLGRYVK